MKEKNSVWPITPQLRVLLKIDVDLGARSNIIKDYQDLYRQNYVMLFVKTNMMCQNSYVYGISTVLGF